MHPPLCASAEYATAVPAADVMPEVQEWYGRAGWRWTDQQDGLLQGQVSRHVAYADSGQALS